MNKRVHTFSWKHLFCISVEMSAYINFYKNILNFVKSSQMPPLDISILCTQINIYLQLYAMNNKNLYTMIDNKFINLSKIERPVKRISYIKVISATKQSRRHKR